VASTQAAGGLPGRAAAGRPPAAAGHFDTYVQQAAVAYGATAEPIAGLGERAVLVGNQLLVLQRRHMYIFVLGSTLAPAGRGARLRQLASTVIGRAAA
jgi:hypothetical protein